MFEFPVEAIPFEMFLIIFGIGASVAGAKIINWLKRKAEKKRKHLDDVKDLRKAVWRLTKTVIILAKMLDNMSQKTHPELEAQLEEIARELLITTNDYEEEA